MNIDNKRRVVVTGMGVVSSVGIGLEKFWKNLISGKSGISKVESFDTSKYRTHRGGEIKDFDPNRFMDKPGKKGRSTQFLLAAMKMAIEDAGIDLSRLNPDDAGVIVGITALEPKVLEEITNIRISKGVKHVPPPLIAKGTIHSSSIVAGCEFGLRGVNVIISTACSASNYAIGYGYDLLRQGLVKTAFCGGADAFSRVIFTGFNRLFAVAPEKCQPFDKNRRGMITGEGSGMLVLETLESALKRKSKIYAEVAGYGLSCDAFNMTAPSRDGIRKVLERALENSGIRKEAVDYINAHGTGTPNNDRAEAGAIRDVFGKLADIIPVTSIKSMVGHTLGAAGAIEAISCCLTIRKGIIPPTINFETPDPECRINVVANKARKQNVDIALNNSFAFGGNNACVVFRKLNYEKNSDNK